MDYYVPLMFNFANWVANAISIINKQMQGDGRDFYGRLPIARVTKDIWITNESQLSK